jgi:regulator of CtrA degradation
MNADITFREEGDPVDFGRNFVHSEAFRQLFGEGMGLVEQTAAYLDGDGREESRLLSRNASLTYASESMRLTTRLMQIASWLLVQRAVAEGEISPDQAMQEKTRVRLSKTESHGPGYEASQLPPRLVHLIAESRRLHARIIHLDALVASDEPAPLRRTSPVADQQSLLRSAFGLH